jgi:cell wall-associated NlpC family hydrolase
VSGHTRAPGSRMLRSRLLISLLFIAFALGTALLKPLSSRAEDGTAAVPADPTPPTDTTPVVPPIPVVRTTAAKKKKRARTIQSHLAFGTRVVDYARKFRGVRYEYGGSTPRTGFDCSGFVRYVYAHFGFSLAHSSYAQFDRGRRVSRASLRPGDLVFFDGLGHVGIYIGNGRFIHAPHSGTRVRIETLSGWYSSRFVGARRLRSS